jgi:hypothetical protein|tara:strand:- start:386 stop:640 length:255 start_codon:yes stop_codon:yes gene_type:complete
MPNSLITLLGTELTTNNNVGREVERPTTNQVIEKKLNYQILYKMVESAVEEIMLEYPNDPVVDELKAKIIKNLTPVIKQILPTE